MAVYLVERYLPAISQQELAAARARLRLAVAELQQAGETIRYLGSTFLPEEDSCFCQFEALSRSLVERASNEARFPFARITEAFTYTDEEEEQCAG